MIRVRIVGLDGKKEIMRKRKKLESKGIRVYGKIYRKRGK